MKVIQCDRCGKSRPDVKDKVGGDLSLMVFAANHELKRDLCEGCTQELSSWLRNPPLKQAAS